MVLYQNSRAHCLYFLCFLYIQVLNHHLQLGAVLSDKLEFFYFVDFFDFFLTIAY